MSDKDKIRQLEEELAKFKSSPYAATYMTIYSQIVDMNKQLTITEETISDTVLTKDGVAVTMERQQGKVDLFAPSNEKSFERAWKVMTDVDELLETLDKLRSKMSGEEQQSADKAVSANNFFNKNRS